MKFLHPESYEIPFRPVFEVYQAAVWTGAAIFAVGYGMMSSFPPAGVTVVAAVAAGTMAVYRGLQAWPRLQEKKRLTGSGLESITLTDLKKKMKPGHTWVGKGFTWTSHETQLLHDLIQTHPEKWLPKEANEKGAHWIHGVGKEEDRYIPTSYFDGMTLIAGTTGAGKTRYFDLLVSQAILRGEAVVILDPKGDKDLREKARRTCIAMGYPDKFLAVLPSHPEISARINPLANFNRTTEPAGRVSSLIPSETGSDPFTAFGWQVLNNISQGLFFIGETLTLKKLKKYAVGGVEDLLIKVLRKHFGESMENWESMASPYIKKHKGREAEALIDFYRKEIETEHPISEMESLIAQHEHNRDHLSKMIASLLPLLNQLTSGAIGELLSPEVSPDDKRPITDLGRAIANKQVLYIGLDSLSDKLVGSAIGAVILADLAAVAGDRYNYQGDNLDPVNIFVDEAAEIVNDPLIQLLNKGRGAKMRVLLATQTFADFEARFGSTAKARQALGNLNNMFSLRVLDEGTQQYIAEGLPEVYIRTFSANYRHSVGDNPQEGMDAGYGESLGRETVPLFPRPMLGRLPDLHYVARLTGGAFIKARLPLIQD